MKLLRIYFSFFVLLSIQLVQSQEINATVQVNVQNIAQRDQSIFQTLETSMEEFLNTTKWTDQRFKEEERVNMSLVFVVNEFNDDQFSGNFQISASRPVYNSSYTSTIFNYKDQDINFNYIENAALFYNDNQFSSDLSSRLA